jgi:hypothetical protein
LGGFRRPQNLFGISPHEHAHFNFVYFRYDKVIDYYVKLFGKKNVHVVLFEQLRENPQTTLDELFGFMNIAALPLPLDVLNQEENVSLSNATIWAELFLNRFLGSKVNPKPIIPTRIVNARVLYHFMSRWLDPLIFRRFSKINKKKSLITPSMISFCRDYYREGNQSLVDTYQLPLGKYGYSL